MNEKQHPLTLAEILDRTASLYRSRFVVFFGIGFIPVATMILYAGAFVASFAWFGSTSSSRMALNVGNVLAWSFVGVTGLLALPVCLGATALGWAAMSHAAARAFLDEKFNVRGAYRYAWKHGWRYVWLYVVVAFFVAIAPVVVFFIAAPISAGLIALGERAGFGSVDALVSGAMFLILATLFLYAVWMLVRLCLAFPACVVEQTTAWKAIKRSAALSKGTKGRIILLYLLGTALSWLLALGFLVPVGILLALVPAANDPRYAQTLGIVMVFTWYGIWFLVQALTRPIYGIGLTLFYFDQRIRKEGFDIEWMMQRAGMILAPQPLPEAALPARTDPLLPGVSQS
jgi:hypothetical protein